MFHIAIEFKNPEKGQQFLSKLVPQLKGAGTIVASGMGPFSLKPRQKEYKDPESEQRARESTPQAWARTAWYCVVHNKTNWFAIRSELSALKKGEPKKWQKIDEEFREFMVWMTKARRLSMDDAYRYVSEGWKKDREGLSVLVHEHRRAKK